MMRCSTAGMDLFWANETDSIRSLWELKQPMRCEDPWYNGILHSFRHGVLTMDTYHLLHGFPTTTPGS